MRLGEALVRAARAIALIAFVTLAIALARPLAAQGQPGRSACTLRPAKWADPTTLRLGERTTVTLATTSACPARVVPLHVVLSIDASTSMVQGGKFDAAKEAAKRFLDGMDLSVSRVGVTAFTGTPTVVIELADQRDAIVAAVDAIATGRGTDIAGGIDVSAAVLQRGRPASGPRPIEAIVVLSDGRQQAAGGGAGGGGGGSAAVLAAADRAKADGILVVTVCFGEDCQADVMRQAASRPDLYFDAADAEGLLGVYRTIANQLVATSLRTLSLVDTLPANMRYVAGSAAPPPSATGPDWLRWDWSVVPASGVTVTFQVEPLEAGRWPTNVRAVADFRDTEDLPGQATFPVPEVLVVAPTPAPTATPTAAPTPRPTAVPVPIYLPIALREHCDPLVESTDVALVIDVSDSMNDPTQAGGMTKREAARRAALAFVERLTMPGDQVAVIAFSDRAQVLAPLGAGRAQVVAALGRLPQSTGTRIDAGLDAGMGELTSARRRRANLPALLLVTDGRPTRSGEAEVRGSALAVRGAGITVYAIGLGADVNPALLVEVAGDAARYIAAPQAEDLERIYGRLARTVPCPTGRHEWGRPWP